MKIIPAIDLRGGRCVRLFQGDFERETGYGDDPVAQALRFAALDVTDLHIVDLDGARNGRPRNSDAVSAIVAALAERQIAVQLGGGLRDRSSLMHWLERGVRRVVIGSTAVTDPAAVRRWLEDCGGERVVLAFDVAIDATGTPRVATHGWTKASGQSLWACIERFLPAGLVHVLCTDIRRDGALSGPNLALYRDLLTRYPSLNLQASGGIRDAEDLHALRAIGVPAAISGRALLDGRITPAEVASFRQSA